MLIKKLFGKRHLTFLFFIISSNYEQEVQIIHDLKSIQLLPLRSVHFCPVVQIRGTVLASHAEIVFSSKQQQNPYNPYNPYNDEILTNSNCTSHFTNKWP